MKRTIEARLLDAIQALDAVERHTSGLSRAEFDASEITQHAVERLLITVGEALSEAESTYPEIVDKIPDIRKIVGTRNRLVHNYWNVDPNVLWDVIVVKGAELRATLLELLDEYR
jgi:uncharacterized protein with HEPN domain